MDKLIAVAARILLALPFLIVGTNKVLLTAQHPGFYDQFLAQLGSMGLPPILAPVMILVEVIGGLALLTGFKTRAAAWTLAVYSVVLGLLLHWSDGLWIQNFAIAGGLLAIIAAGISPYSLDSRKQ
jgi:putative oxidoreductase